MRRANVVFTPAMDREIVERFHARETMPAIAEALGVPKEAVNYRIYVLRRSGIDLPKRYQESHRRRREEKTEGKELRPCNICSRPTWLGPYERYCANCREGRVAEIARGFHA